MPPVRDCPVPTLPSSDCIEVPCPLCDSRDAIPRHRFGEFTYRTCRDCGLIYLSPRPREEMLFRLYQRYLPDGPTDREAWASMMEPVHRDLAARATRANGGPGSVCDVGCGHGFLLEHFRRRGWEVHGVEVNEGAVCEARRRTGGAIHHGTLASAALDPDRYDAITACYVIEHLASPVEFLREARRALRPGGHLLLRWPHTTPLCDLLARTPWRPNLYDAPWHLVDFSPSTLARALDAAGFSEIRTHTGGWTRPPGVRASLASAAGGALSEGIERWTRGKAWLPGVSKTTTARC